MLVGCFITFQKGFILYVKTKNAPRVFRVVSTRNTRGMFVGITTKIFKYLTFKKYQI